METNPTRAALQADPKIVKKARRNNAAYGSFNALPGEQDQEHMHHADFSRQAPRPLEFGRPGL